MEKGSSKFDMSDLQKGMKGLKEVAFEKGSKSENKNEPDSKSLGRLGKFIMLLYPVLGYIPT